MIVQTPHFCCHQTLAECLEEKIELSHSLGHKRDSNLIHLSAAKLHKMVSQNVNENSWLRYYNLLTGFSLKIVPSGDSS